MESKDGSYWIATDKGLCHFDAVRARAQPNAARFACLRPAETEGAANVRALLADRMGALWAGTAGGLYRIEGAGGEWRLQYVPLDQPARQWQTATDIQTLFAAGDGSLWIGTRNGLCRRSPDGGIERYEFDLPAANEVYAIAEDRQSVWVGTRGGLLRMVPEAGHFRVSRVFREKDGLPSRNVRDLSWFRGTAPFGSGPALA